MNRKPAERQLIKGLGVENASRQSESVRITDYRVSDLSNRLCSNDKLTLTLEPLFLHYLKGREG